MAWSNDRVNSFRGVRVILKNWFEVKFWFKEDFWGWDGNVKFKKGPEEVFEILRCLMVLRLLNDHNVILFIEFKVINIERIYDES